MSDNKEVIVQQDNTLKIVFIVLLTLAIVFLCCIISCFAFTLGASYLTSYRLSNQLPNNTTPPFTKEITKFNVEVTKVETEGSRYILTLSVKNTGKTGTTFSTFSNLDMVVDDFQTIYDDYLYYISPSDSLNKYIAPGATIIGKVAFDVKKTNPTSLTLEVKDNDYKVIQEIPVKTPKI